MAAGKLPALRELGGTLLLKVRVQPGASRAGAAGLHGDALKLKVRAPPERGRANEEAGRLLAELLQLTTSQVSLERGATGREKWFRIERIGREELERRLETLLAGAS